MSAGLKGVRPVAYKRVCEEVRAGVKMALGGGGCTVGSMDLTRVDPYVSQLRGEDST